MFCRSNHKTETDRRGCVLERTAMSVICQQKCVTEYGPTEPSEPSEPTKPVGPTDPTIPPTSTTHL